MESSELRELVQSPYRKICVEHALVLRAVGIPHEILERDGAYRLVVPDEFYGIALKELKSYEEENRGWRHEPAPSIEYNGWPGVVGYIGVLLLVAISARQDFGGHNWFQTGRLDAGLVADGQWWRTVTALTLHADIGHLASNIGFGTLFGYFTGQLFGSGFAWFCVVVAASLGNGINAWIHPDTHTSVGASTAVFASLGLLSAAAWIRRRHLDHRWAYRFAPLFGGIALLAYTGLGGERTDVGAHVAGFVVGVAGGAAYALAERYTDFSGLNQRLFGALACAIVGLAWLYALGG